jgi:hypothetical protein
MKKSRRERPALEIRARGALLALLVITGGAWRGLYRSASLPGPPLELRCEGHGREVVITSRNTSSRADLDCSPKAAFLLGQTFDLNSATAADLARLPAIGPRTAGAILALRKRQGSIKDFAELNAVTELSPAGRDSLRRYTHLR